MMCESLDSGAPTVVARPLCCPVLADSFAVLRWCLRLMCAAILLNQDKIARVGTNQTAVAHSKTRFRTQVYSKTGCGAVLSVQEIRSSTYKWFCCTAVRRVALHETFVPQVTAWRPKVEVAMKPLPCGHKKSSPHEDKSHPLGNFPLQRWVRFDCGSSRRLDYTGYLG